MKPINTILTLILTAFLFNVLNANAETITVGKRESYSSLQNAYQAAKSGDTIVLKDSRTYSAIPISKPKITITSESTNRASIKGSFEVTAPDVTINNVRISAPGEYAIRAVGNVARLTVKNCEITNSSYALFYDNLANDIASIQIEGNTAYGNENDFWINSANGGTISNNNSSSQSGIGIGLGYKTSHFKVFQNNTHANGIENRLSARHGINVQGEQNSIHDNVSYGNTWGISIGSGRNNIIESNTFYNNTHENLLITDKSSGNVFSRNIDYFDGKQEAYMISFLFYNSDSNTIDHHTSYNSKVGVWFKRLDGAGPSRHNVVTNSVFYGVASQGEDTIGIKTGDHESNQGQINWNVFYNFATPVSKDLNAHTVHNRDPQFVDETHGNFTLKSGAWSRYADSSGRALGAAH